MTRPEFAQQIASRRSTSPKHLLEPAPSAEVLEAAAAAAFAAPSHFSVFPVRFVIIENRERLAHLFEAELPADADAEKYAKAAGKAKKGPMQIAVVIAENPNDTPRERMERSMTAGAALANFLNVLHEAGFGGKTVSGRAFRAPDGLYDPEKETLAAFIICGTPDEEARCAFAQLRETSKTFFSRW